MGQVPREYRTSSGGCPSCDLARGYQRRPRYPKHWVSIQMKHNQPINSDSEKRRSFVALLFAAGYEAHQMRYKDGTP